MRPEPLQWGRAVPIGRVAGEAVLALLPCSLPLCMRQATACVSLRFFLGLFLPRPLPLCMREAAVLLPHSSCVALVPF